MSTHPPSARIATALVVTTIVALPLLLIAAGLGALVVIFAKPDLIVSREVLRDEAAPIAERFLRAWSAQDEESLRGVLVEGEREAQAEAARLGAHISELMPLCESGAPTFTLAGTRAAGERTEVDVEVSPCPGVEGGPQRFVLPLEPTEVEEGTAFASVVRHTFRVDLGFRAYIAATQAPYVEEEGVYAEFIHLGDTLRAGGPTGLATLTQQVANQGSRGVTELLLEARCANDGASMQMRPVDPHVRRLARVGAEVMEKPLAPGAAQVASVVLTPELARCEQIGVHLVGLRLAPAAEDALPQAKGETCGRVAELELGTLLLPSLKTLRVGPGCALGSAPAVEVRVPGAKPRQLAFVRTPAGMVAKNLGRPADVRFNGEPGAAQPLDGPFYLDVADTTMIFRPVAAQ